MGQKWTFIDYHCEIDDYRNSQFMESKRGLLDKKKRDQAEDIWLIYNATTLFKSNPS